MVKNSPPNLLLLDSSFVSAIKSLYKFLSPKYQKIFLEYKVDPKPRYGFGKPANEYLFEIINSKRIEYSIWLQKFLQFKDVFFSIRQTNAALAQDEPVWNNQYLPGLDIVALYGIVSLVKPKRMIEIGSGNSTRISRMAIDNNGLDTRLISIDPFPRVFIDHVSDEVIRSRLEDLTDFSDFDRLDENDILFIDNSHRCLPNSDVMVCFLEILPRLKKNVIVHVHDIYLPYDYPQFMCNRFYSEQYILAASLIANRNKYEILLPNYFISEDNELKKILDPIWSSPKLKSVERHGGSFWFKTSC